MKAKRVLVPDPYEGVTMALFGIECYKKDAKKSTTVVSLGRSKEVGTIS
jgi:hypothetical protein